MLTLLRAPRAGKGKNGAELERALDESKEPEAGAKDDKGPGTAGVRGTVQHGGAAGGAEGHCGTMVEAVVQE